MSANIVIGKCKLLNTKHESEEILNYCLIFSGDFNAFLAISLRKTAMCWITENHFLFAGQLDWGNPETQPFSETSNGSFIIYLFGV